MASAPILMPLAPHGSEFCERSYNGSFNGSFNGSYTGSSGSFSPPRGILKPTTMDPMRTASCSVPEQSHVSWENPSERRNKTVNFWLETPYHTLSKVRSHCLIESHGSSDRIHSQAEMADIRDATVSKAVHNILFSMSGTFVLVVPGLFQRTSWWGVPMILIIGYGMHHAAQCITRFVLDDPSLLTYRHVGTKAMGTFGSYLVLVLQVINYMVAALVSLKLGIDCMTIVFLQAFASSPAMPYTEVVYIATFLALPFFFIRNLDNIGFMSLLGYLASLLAVFCMTANVALALLHHQVEVFTHHASGHIEGVLSASTVICFGFGGHMNLVFPGLLGVMKKPEEYPKALTIAFLSKALAFTLFPAFCFYSFGGDIQQNVLHNMPPGPLTSLALFLMTSQCLFMVAVVLNPLFYLTELTLGIEQAGFHRQKLPDVISRCIVRSLMAGTLGLVAIHLWHKGLTIIQLMQFVGGSTVLLSAWLLPVALYLKHFCSGMRAMELIKCIIMLGLGCVIFGFNTQHTVVPVMVQLTCGATHAHALPGAQLPAGSKDALDPPETTPILPPKTTAATSKKAAGSAATKKSSNGGSGKKSAGKAVAEPDSMDDDLDLVDDMLL